MTRSSELSCHIVFPFFKNKKSQNSKALHFSIRGEECTTKVRFKFHRMQKIFGYSNNVHVYHIMCHRYQYINVHRCVQLYKYDVNFNCSVMIRSKALSLLRKVCLVCVCLSIILILYCSSSVNCSMWRLLTMHFFWKCFFCTTTEWTKSTQWETDNLFFNFPNSPERCTAYATNMKKQADGMEILCKIVSRRTKPVPPSEANETKKVVSFKAGSDAPKRGPRMIGLLRTFNAGANNDNPRRKCR